MRQTAIVMGVALALAWAIPATGATSLLRLDKREKQHYKLLDQRIKAATLVALNDRIDTTVQSVPMTFQPPTSFSASASCLPGYRLTGGGVTWGGLTYGGYHVIESGPDPGGIAWDATVSTGGSPLPATPPTVRAVCARAA